MITFSAPGKIHLLGEHTVVHGKPALLAAISLRVYVSIEARVNPPSPRLRRARKQEASSFAKATEDKEVTKVVENAIKKKFKIKKIPAYNVTITSQIPIGGGLGSSAAVSAAYSAALLSFLKIPFDKKLINELAYKCDMVFNGNPSGGDNTTVVYGGLLWYRKELEFLKTFSPLPFKIHKNIKPFYLIDSGKPKESTKQMVDLVSDKLQVARVKTIRIFENQEELVKKLVLTLKEGKEKELIGIIREGESNLEKLGVVGKKAKKIIRLIEKAGGAAKIMGGGGIKEGSGMLLCYHKDPQVLQNLAKESNLKLIKVKLESEGLRKEFDKL